MAEIKETKKETAAKEKMVKIKIARTPGKKDEEDVFVSVNERTWLIKRGEYVEVPECVKEVIDLQERMLDEASDFESQVQTQY
jgi:hypothetical protein